MKRQDNQAVPVPVTAGSTDQAETYTQLSTDNREPEQEYTQLQIVPLCNDYELEPVSREDNDYVNTGIQME